MDRFTSRDFIILIKNFINLSLTKFKEYILTIIIYTIVRFFIYDPIIGFFAETQQTTFIYNRINYIILKFNLINTNLLMI